MDAKRILGMGLSAIALSSICLPALADMTVIKTVEKGKAVIYVKGAAVNSQIEMETSAGTRPVAILANGCGVIRVRSNQHNGSKIVVNGEENFISDLATKTDTACNGNSAPSAENFSDAQGNVYIVGLANNAAATVLVPSGGKRTARANGCGIAKFTEREAAPWTASSKFKISGTEYTMSEVTLQTYPDYCRNTGTSSSPNYVRYEPAS